jgi:hypothetical protein
MSILLTTRGLGKRGGLLVTAGLGRRLVLAVDGETETHDRFQDLRNQIEHEDDILMAMCRGLLNIICR